MLKYILGNVNTKSGNQKFIKSFSIIKVPVSDFLLETSKIKDETCRENFCLETQMTKKKSHMMNFDRFLLTLNLNNTINLSFCFFSDF